MAGVASDAAGGVAPGRAGVTAPDGGFALTGPRRGQQITVTWSPVGGGTVGGDAEAVEIVTRLATLYEGKLIGLLGAPPTTHDHLSSPYTACRFMERCFDRGVWPTMTGSLPKLPDPPEGAVR